MNNILDHGGFKLKDIKGIFFNPVTYNFSFTVEKSINYILCAEKIKSLD